MRSHPLPVLGLLAIAVALLGGVAAAEGSLGTITIQAAHTPPVAPAVAQPSSPSVAAPSPSPVASLAPLGQPGQPTTVAIVGRVFEPSSLTVSAGSTVEWTNRDGQGHTVSATDGSFASGLMAAGMTFTMRFDSPGVYDYACGIHPDMRASVTVVAAAEPEVSAATPQSASPSAEAAAAGADQATVTIAQTAYGPASVEIAAGSTVSWTNEDPVIHTVTARDGSFNSGVLQPGAGYRLVFETPGTYDYFCAVHPGQAGTVVVSDG